MIAPLRRRHRLMTLVLALTLPALVGMAVMGREPVPFMAAEALPGPEHVELERGPGTTVSEHLLLRFVLSGGAGPGFPVDVALRRDLAHGRTLLYWHPQRSAESPLTDGRARFLGVLSTKAIQLSGDVLSDSSKEPSSGLIVWDVARGEVLERFDLLNKWILEQGYLEPDAEEDA